MVTPPKAAPSLGLAGKTAAIPSQFINDT